MQVLQGKAAAFGKWDPAPPAPHRSTIGGLMQKEEIFPWAAQSLLPGLGSCLYFWPQEPATVSLHPLFSLRGATQLL